MDNQDQHLYEKTDSQTNGDGIVGNLDRKRNFAGLAKTHAQQDKVPCHEKADTENNQAGQKIKDLFAGPAVCVEGHLHEDVDSFLRSQRHGETDHDGTPEGDKVIDTGDRVTEIPEDDVEDRQKHDENEGGSSDDTQEPTQSGNKLLKPLHENPLPQQDNSSHYF